MTATGGTFGHRTRLLVQWAAGFFIDDGINALLTIAWIGVVLTIARFIPGQAWLGVVLAIGLSVLFVVSIILRVRRAKK